MTQDEPDTCRICSAPAEPDAPLFHPCRCSGTIRYIHQDCLTTWLAHSKKKSCDVCKYQYAFTKVYSENMPRQIPFILFLRKFAQKTFWAIVLAIRGLMVATIWLAFLPYVTVWTWRFYFIMGDNIAWWIYDHPRPAPTPLFHAYFTNLTFNDDRNQTSSPDRTFLDLVTSYPIWRALSADIFTGQIIASLIILVFLGIFLLREWIIQNARPGVFEEENDLDIDVQDGIVADVEPAAVPEDAAAAAEPVLVANEPVGDDPTEERGRDFVPEHAPLESDVGDHPSEGIGRGAEMTHMSSPVLVQEGDSDIRLAESRKEDGDDEDLFAFTYERPDSPPATSEPYSFAKRMEEINRNIQPSRSSRKSLAPSTIEPNEAGPSGSQLHSRTRSLVSPTGSPDSFEGGTDASLSVNAAGPSSIAVAAPYTGQSNAESASSEGSESEYQYNHDSLDSEGDSISSSVPTVGSEIRDDLDEYFPELEEEDRPGPIRVAELLNNEEQVDDAVEEAEDQEAVEAPENQDNINDDDVDGALEEAVGMRGPLTTVFQNAALMIFVLDTTIGVAVWLPFTIGKTIALLSLEPIRILRLLQWPVRIIRYATDPLVDLLALSVFRVIQIIAGIFGVSMSGDAGQAQSPYNLASTKLFFESGFLGLFTQVADGRSSTIARGIGHMADSPVGQFLEPFFAWLGRRVRLNATWLKAGWMELAGGDATINRCFAIALGYLIDGLLLAIYLNVLNVGNVQSAGRAIRNAIKQQLVVLKVAAFILIELVLFPLGCGVMLDFCTLRLLPDATVQSRLSFFAYAPVTASFYHWMIGTMFMYQFALLLGGCRKIMRPGALWFIKDPQDQSFHPVRDILDRPTLIQIRKLFLSALMYSFVVALGMGGLVTCVRLWGKLLLPLRWNLRKPLFDVPIDLLFLHIVIPPTVKYFRPRKFAFTLAKAYWRWASKRLRLTSYMFGGMHPDEMRSSGDVHSWLLSVLGLKAAEGTDVDASARVDGTYRRVPAQDNISLPQEIRATVPVDKYGKPLDDAGKRLIELQDSEAEKAKRRASDDYTVIYLPPHSKGRVILFVICLWIAGSSTFVASLAIPTLLGRAVFAVTLHREVHDGYSFIVGFYLLWGCYRVGLLLDHFDKRRQRSSNRHNGLKYAVYAFKRSMLWIGNAVWVAFWFGIVIPTLLALVVEVYVVHPLRVMFKPDLTLKIRIFDSWAVGLLYTKMAISTMRLRPETRIDTAIREMRQRGWRDLNAVQVTLDIIAPVVAGLIGMLLLPIMLVLGLQQILPTKISSNSLCQSPPFALLNVSLLSAGEHYLRALSCPSIAVLYVYPGIFVFAAGARMYGTLQSVLAAWAQQIRDSEFLVEMRLRNLDVPDQKTGYETNHPPMSSQVQALR